MMKEGRVFLGDRGVDDGGGHVALRERGLRMMGERGCG